MRATFLAAALLTATAGCDGETGASRNPGRVSGHDRDRAMSDRGYLFDSANRIMRTFRIWLGDPEAYAMRGWERTATFEMEGALADLDEAIRLRPDYGFAHAVRGFVHRTRLRLDLAEADLDLAVRLEPHWPGSFFNRSGMLLQRGDLEGARRDLDMALRLRPDGAMTLAHRCLVAFRSGEKAADSFCEATLAADVRSARRDGGASWLLLIRGGLHMLRNDPAAARTAVDGSIMLLSRNPHALLLRGILRARDGDAEGAAADMEAARAILPEVDVSVQALFGPLPTP